MLEVRTMAMNKMDVITRSLSVRDESIRGVVDNWYFAPVLLLSIKTIMSRNLFFARENGTESRGTSRIGPNRKTGTCDCQSGGLETAFGGQIGDEHDFGEGRQDIFAGKD